MHSQNNKSREISTVAKNVILKIKSLPIQVLLTVLAGLWDPTSLRGSQLPSHNQINDKKPYLLTITEL